MAFSSVKDMSLLKNHTPPSQDNATKTESTRPSVDESSVSESRTPTSPTESTVLESEKESTGTPPLETRPQEDARRTDLTRRRHTVFISHLTHDKNVRRLHPGDRGGTDETADTNSDDSIQQTQSLPQINYSASDSSTQGQDILLSSDAGSSEGFKCVMEEVKRQREQLLAFHKQQSEEKVELECEAKEEGSDEEHSSLEDIQPMEGIHSSSTVYIL